MTADPATAITLGPGQHTGTAGKLISSFDPPRRGTISTTLRARPSSIQTAPLAPAASPVGVACREIVRTNLRVRASIQLRLRPAAFATHTFGPLTTIWVGA